MLIRPERRGDAPAISEVLAEAFRIPDSPAGPVPEVGLVDSLRNSDAWIPRQSLVAVTDDEIVGYCVCTRAHLEDVPCLALGPIGVAVVRQQTGIGTALVNHAIVVAIEMGEPIIGLLGDHRYYRRFGFVPGRRVGIEPPDPSWGDAFQVKLLPAFPGVSGVFRYQSAFSLPDRGRVSSRPRSRH